MDVFLKKKAAILSSSTNYLPAKKTIVLEEAYADKEALISKDVKMT